MVNKKLNEVLGISDELEDEIVEDVIITPEECIFDDENPDADIIEDYRFIRKKLRYSIAACEKVLQQSLRDLVSNPSPRGVEGCSTIIKAITECTSQMLDVHGKVKKMKPVKNEELNGSEEGGSKKDKVKATINDILESMEENESDE